VCGLSIKCLIGNEPSKLSASEEEFLLTKAGLRSETMIASKKPTQGELREDLLRIYGLLDKTFFFGSLKARVPLVFYDSSHLPLDDPRSKYLANLSMRGVTIPQSEKGWARGIHMNLDFGSKYPTTSNPRVSNSQRLRETVAVLAHECIHAYFQLFACKCSQMCDEMNENPHRLGLTGHGVVFCDVARALEFRLQEDLNPTLELGIRTSLHNEIHCSGGWWKSTGAEQNRWGVSDLHVRKSDFPKFNFSEIDGIESERDEEFNDDVETQPMPSTALLLQRIMDSLSKWT